MPSVETPPVEELDEFTGLPKKNRVAKAKAQAEKNETVAAKALLNLDDQISNEYIYFRGKAYNLRTQQSLGSRQRHELKHYGEEFHKLWETAPEELGDEGYARQDYLRDVLVDIVLEAPDSVKDQMSSVDKENVILAFTMAPLARRAVQSQQQDR